MARKRLTVEGQLVGHFATVELGEGYRLLDLAKGILAARVAHGDAGALSPSIVVRKRKPRKARAAKGASVEEQAQA